MVSANASLRVTSCRISWLAQASLRVEFRIYKKQIKQENLLFQELVYENDVALLLWTP